MKTVFIAASLALSMTVLQPAIAAEDHEKEATAAATHVGRGKVVSVDNQAGTVKLTHDPIKSLKWPKMTMDFKAHDPAMLKDVKPGAQVDFELMKMGGGYHIMKISPSTEGHKHGDDSTAAKESHHAHDGAHGHGDSAAGRPGNPKKISRTIKITALDIKYDKPEIQIKAGETIKFVVTNTGKLRHEFMIGDMEEQRQHAEMMKQMPDMVHEDANTLTLEPGETKSLVWQFTKTGALEVACHIPGHYEAGMVSKVIVSKRK
ncbi:MAG TPA: copper-binding protein [Burkholderiales bacterium]|nr:copper-binding protein [Burkholderiales bacterium]